MRSEKRYQIFVSSTYTDLMKARQEVTQNILNINHIPAGMEMFSASGRPQWKTIEKAINNSDYYVLIVGDRYGSISSDDGISYTEKEFDYALSCGIPTLCFLPGENYSSTKKNRESEQNLIEKLDNFKNRIKESQLIDYWNDEDELVKKVINSLYKIFTEEPGVGWIRGDSVDTESLNKLVHAMEENKKLNMRINELERNSLVRVPELSVLLNGIKLTSNDNYLIKLPVIKDDKIVFFQQDLSLSDISGEMVGFISEEDLEKYNKGKPNDEDIEKYHTSYQLYQAATDFKMKFSICNSGNVKANNILINIKFPDGVDVFYGDNTREIKEPELFEPASPLELFHRRKRNNFPFGDLNYKKPIISGLGSDSFLSRNVRSLNEKLRIEDNEIKGSTKSVTHDCVLDLTPEFCFLFRDVGEYTIEVNIHCDEYPKWQSYQCVIKVE
ncbi:DUF4062 domain-containing protein [Morganella morganii]|uniref:DUF4062 domain-containing protein n=1 Tax=Morganella morganii TaxID=582 RepID=UPI000D1F7586|nr:DUF4062 domain-containing protein [Morganella morganii]HAE78991.1 hypothetical protein [Morganella sp. (in: enterobacteria)]QXO54977.1 DUF4062 domain-containing protein [Morganella morganii]QXO58865.1 DUF4062 domain-containing protein [Morganella morganii]QXO62670.1 DUF4062 domain-containing protein [Morganella morganii]QXO77829.1 DUF4062 domain-containing protein [Morganella morganii]